MGTRTLYIEPGSPCENHVWSYDFVSAMTHDGRMLRMLTLIDEYTRECLAMKFEASVASTLETAELIRQ